MVVAAQAAAAVQRRPVVMALLDSPALVQANRAEQAADPTAVQAELLLWVQIHQVIQDKIPHIQVVAVAVAVVLVEIMLLFPPVQAELAPPSNKHPIVQWLVLVVVVVVHTDPMVLRVQAVYMAVEQAELATLAALLLALKALLFLHTIRPLNLRPL
jgi:hypothetical protein